MHVTKQLTEVCRQCQLSGNNCSHLPSLTLKLKYGSPSENLTNTGLLS